MQSKKSLLLLFFVLIFSLTPIHAQQTENLDKYENQTELNSQEFNKDEMGKVDVYYESIFPYKQLEKITLSGTIGDSYKAEVKDFPGYMYTGLSVEDQSDPLEGVFTKEPQFVFLQYEELTFQSININIRIIDAGNKKELRPENIDFELISESVDGQKNSLLNEKIDLADHDMGNHVDYSTSITDVSKIDDTGGVLDFQIMSSEIEGYRKEVIIEKTYYNILEIWVNYVAIASTVDIKVSKEFGYETLHRVANQFNEEYDSLIPSEVFVHILKDGKDVEGSPLILNEENYWYDELTGLINIDSDGNEIEYSVVEEEINGFVPEIELLGDNTNCDEDHRIIEYKIRNLFVEDVTVQKIWENGPDIKPEITLQLFAEWGEFDKEVHEVGNPVILKDGNTSYTWSKMPSFELVDGLYPEEITYFVKEVEVPVGYSVEYSEDRLTVINHFTGNGIETDITGEKIWKDDNNASELRPDMITLELYKDNELINTLNVTEEMNWKYSFGTYPKYENKELIKYKIKEVPVAHYETTINNYTITNTLIKEDVPEVPINPEKPTDPEKPEGLLPQEPITPEKPTEPQIDKKVDDFKIEQENIQAIPETAVFKSNYFQYSMVITLCIILLLSVKKVKNINQ